MVPKKKHTLPASVIQAPMAGISDLPFRLLGREHGLRYAYVEMISSEALIRSHEKTGQLLHTVEQDRPVGVQIVGCNPDSMGRAAEILDAAGIFDSLDINLGCPVPKITGPGGGSALLREPALAKAIFTRVVHSAGRLRVTVKMRLGYSDASGAEAVTIAKIAQDCGIRAITVHGRTRSQGYSGTADYRAIGTVKQAVRIPVIGNGDVVDAASALRLREISGCDTIMIGRGAMGNPWIYHAIEEALQSGKAIPAPIPKFETRKQTLLHHLDLQVLYGGPRCFLAMRRIACWYLRGVPGVAAFRDQINKTEGAPEVRKLIEDFNPHRTALIEMTEGTQDNLRETAI